MCRYWRFASAYENDSRRHLRRSERREPAVRQAHIHSHPSRARPGRKGRDRHHTSTEASTSLTRLNHAQAPIQSVAQAYRGTYDPNSPFTNFIGGSFASLRGGVAETVGFAFAAEGCYCSPPPPTPYTIVVRESDIFGPVVGATYTLLVEGTGVIFTGGGPTATASLQSFRASSAPKGVIVRWKTRSEQNALGFNVYRGAVKKVRLTRSIVRASGDGRGHTYSYIDRSARKGKAAPYYLEVVQRNGSKVMFGPARMVAH
jgi:hypothetical protein